MTAYAEQYERVGHGRCGHWRAMTGRGGRHGHPRGWGWGWGRHGFGPPGGRRTRRGDVRAAALLLLEEEPRNGYQLMQAIEERSEGEWRPSPGSMYPALAQLEDEGLVRTSESEGRRVFELTDEGRAHVEENRERLGTPWETGDDPYAGQVSDLKGLIAQVAMATMQVVRAGGEEQVAEARRILTDARKALYRVLAEVDEEE